MGNGDEATTRPTGDSCGAHKQLLLNTAPSVDLKQKARSDRHQLVLTVVTLAMTTALLARLTSPMPSAFARYFDLLVSIEMLTLVQESPSTSTLPTAPCFIEMRPIPRDCWFVNYASVSRPCLVRSADPSVVSAGDPAQASYRPSGRA
jgi:hypothetical protein